MARTNVDLGSLTIPSAGTDSPALESKVGFGHLIDLIIFVPSTLTGTITCQIAHKESPTAGDWRTLQVQGADLAFAAGKAVIVPAACFRALRMHSSGAEGANRVFYLVGQVEMSGS